MRGLAFFLGIYAAISIVDLFNGGSYNANVWWIDLSGLPQTLSFILQVLVVLALLIFCFKVPRRLGWRITGASIFTVFALFALVNAITVWILARQGTIATGFPVPFSLFIAVAFIVLAVMVFFGYKALPPRRLATFFISLFALILCGVAFPVGQIFCFGLTDYRTSVDAVVVLGAQVYPDGNLSPALAGRVDTAAELYQQGYTPVLIMSGGTGVEGVNEAQAMKGYAISKGVPDSAILLDENGVSTELTVQDTLPIIREQGFRRIGVVSSFYHLARVKMLYLSSGLNVFTIPCDGSKEGDSAFKSALREVPGWWYYWFRSAFNQGSIG
ncbi:MAG: YdcF family protein [Coriobacteriales bacterium]|nr:YdcF family protein [Coriobacteriales bacterium]